MRVLGIDLGTTNSTVTEAVVGPGGRTITTLEVKQETPEGEYVHVLVPSVVAIHRGKTWVGEGAKRLRARAGELGLSPNRDLFWDTKNDIGVRKTYHRAPEGCRNASEIGAHVLRFLAAAAARKGAPPPDRVVVTVPASFQAAQRADTLAAARAAGLPVSDGDLLDEPIAAFLDHADRNGLDALGRAGETKHLLVFDFGGGTCDTAVFRVTLPAPGEPLRAATLAVSRYHRLGGGDVDAALVHQLLIPRLLDENGLGRHDLDYEEKARVVVPALLGVAEALKVGLCSEIRRLRGLGRREGADSSEPDRSDVAKTLPGSYPCRLPDGRDLHLTSPRLTARELDAVLQPFLDEELLYAKGDEYRTTCSIFAPIEDALSRAGLSADQIDGALLVGGSSLIPQVVDSVARRFPTARVFREETPEAVQSSVARGAALHALSLAASRRGLLTPVTGNALSVRTASGLVELVARGTPLPFPASGGFAACTELAVPESRTREPLPLRVELRDGAGGPVLNALCLFPPPVRQGEPLRLRYRVDANQLLHLRVDLPARPGAGGHELRLENPLTNVVNSQPKRERLLEIEESLRTGLLSGSKAAAATEEAARLYADLGQREKALSVYRALLRAKGRPDADLLFRMGLLAGELGDDGREERFYLESAEADPTGSEALFNLALARRRRGLLAEALSTVTEAIRRDPDAAYLVLRALVHDGLGDVPDRDADLARAFATFAPLPTQGDFALAWYLAACRLAGDAPRLAAAEAEEKRRRTTKPGLPFVDGLLPVLAAFAQTN